LLASCSSRQSLFVVLPNPDGSSGAVTIEDGQKSVELDHPYAAGEVRGGVAAPVQVDQAQVQQISATRSPHNRCCQATSCSISKEIATL